MNTHIPKLIFSMIFIMLSLKICCTSSLLTNNPDVRALVILPTSDTATNGLIDLIISGGIAPFQIEYFKVNTQGNPVSIQKTIAINNGDEDLLNVSVGLYKVSITDMYCKHLSLDIIVSLECNCDIPVLSYNDMDCSLSWVSTCRQNGSEYIYTLQKKSGNTWSDIQVVGSPYSIPSGGNGNYRLKVSKNSCPDIFSPIVTTSCTPSSCSCNAPQLFFTFSDCKLTWNTYGCASHTQTLERLTGNNTWEAMGEASSPMILHQNGTYRVKFTSPNCNAICSNELEIECNEGEVIPGSLIINEFGQGCSGVQEYIELIVTGSAPLVSVEGMIIDDNNHLTFEQGNESGHIRLGNCFSSVPVGTVIILYNGAQRNPAINDGPWTFSIDDPCILKYPSCPDNNKGDSGYDCDQGTGGTWQNLIPLYNLRDVVQVRNPDGTLVEAIIYGGANFSGSGGNIINIPNSSNQTRFQRINNTSWSATNPCENTRKSHDFSNNDEHKFIAEIISTESYSLTVMPNPTSQILNVISSGAISSIEIFDFSGKSVAFFDHLNTLTYSLDIRHLSDGIHLVKVIYPDGSTSYKKFLKIY